VKHFFAAFVSLSIVAAAIAPAHALPPPQERNVVITNNVHPKVANGEAQFLKHLDGGTRLELNIILPVRNQAGLTALLQQIYDPTSPVYRHYLSVEEFTERFGPKQEDYDAAIEYLQENGLAVIATSPNRLVLDATGDVSHIQKAFNITLNLYHDPADGSTFFATDTLPSTPGIQLWYVNGLKTKKMISFLRYASQNDKLKTFQTGSGPSGQFLGSDMRAAYYGGTALTGSGQSIGLYGLPFNISDVEAYFSAVNQDFNPGVVQTISIDGFSTTCGSGCDDGEPVIDIVQSLSMAPGVEAVIEYEASNDVDTFNTMATDNVAKQLSASIGFLPADPSSDEPIFQEFAAQGQNLFVSSGDSGAYFGNPTDCQNGSNLNGCIFYPADDPFITSTGGTDLTTNGAGGPWESETAWVGSGGGTSTNGFTIPGYQQITGVINSSNGGSTTLRNIPDLAAEANTDNFFCANGSCQGGVGGTSLSAPRWAGFLALVNEQATSNGAPSVGFLNPTIYAIGRSSSYASDFHDITSGNDANSNASFSAVTGYDLVTGWGSPNGQNMINALAGTTGGNGADVQVNLSSAFNITSAIVTDGTSFSGGGLDNDGNSYSANLLGTRVVVNNITFSLGAANAADAVSNATITLPSGKFATLNLLATAVNGNQASQTFTVHFSDGSTQTITQSLSDWFTPQKFSGETIAVSMAHRDTSSGGTDNRTFDLYSYSFSLTAGKTVSSIVLPADRDVVVLAITLVPVNTAVQASLSSAFNREGIVTDGTSFSGGLDGDGSAYSSNLLGTAISFASVPFTFGTPNQNNAVSGSGQTITLPSGEFSSLRLLATGVNGNQASQTFTVHFSNGSSTSFTQSLSDWFTPQNFSGESIVSTMSRRDINNGTTDDRTFNLYGYSFSLNNTQTVSSITLPNNSNVEVLAITLVP
jgi:subtilase family serine protease